MEIIIDNRAAFDAATRVFVLAPNQDTLLLLNMATSRMFNVISSDVIAAAAAAEDFREPSSNDFSAFRATFDRPLSAAEQNEAGAAIGYALRIYVGGEELDPPRVTDGGKVLEYDYDSSDRRRTEPDFAECFAEAGRYIREGSPVRKTNRAGANTMGTRLCTGIGEIGVIFTVR